MEKILFKFTAIRNPKNKGSTKQLVETINESPILSAISNNETPEKIQEAIHWALNNIIEYTSSEEFKNLLHIYNVLEKEVKNTGEYKIQSERFLRTFTSTSDNDPDIKRLLNLKNKYGNLLTGIKLSSNRTKYSDKGAFIDLLKVWSAISMYESASDSSLIEWLNIYSTTFIVPLNKSNTTKHSKINPDVFYPLSGTTEEEQKALFELFVGDLIVVEEKTVGYLAADIAHIETAMEGELRSKKHRTLDRVERRLTSSESSEVKQSLNLATSSQIGFQSEIEKAEKKKFGGKVESGYKNPAFNLDITAYYDSENKKLDHAIREAAEEITEEARIEVTRKMHKERTEISINEVEIINKHKIENNFGKGNLNGIYQWVDQVKEFKALNYSSHLMAKFVLPNPAKLLFKQQKQEQESSGQEIEFGLAKFSDLDNLSTALEEGKKYGITEFETPPVGVKYISKTIEFSSKTKEKVRSDAGFVVHDDKILIPQGEYDGYEISGVSVLYYCPWLEPNNNNLRKQLNINVFGSAFYLLNKQHDRDIDRWNVDDWKAIEKNGYIQVTKDVNHIMVGTKGFHKQYVSGEIIYHFNLLNTLGIKEIPITVTTRNNNYFQATVTVYLTADNKDEEGTASYEWKKRVYNQLYQAYLEKKKELKRNKSNDKEDRLLGAISGKNPQKNKQIIHEEFKRQIITVLSDGSNHTFEGFFSSSNDDFGVPTDQIRKYSNLVNFFENVIDWEKMSYKLFPYYWHTDANWTERQKYEDIDPHFEAFMKSGASEAIIPIKRSHEREFMHYIEQGELWIGEGEPPLSIISEEHAGLLSEFNEFDSEEVVAEPIEPPWRARIPTSLIILSDENKLDTIPPLNQEEEDGEDQ